ncbi:hypothetical protein QN277_012437 [Acacia crassicarpa]|uniref:IST1-like protein n=1 Tax=Acacia crassicarpa TaxID=499986 RepID=A0AAE1TCZ5_9FABA|nr:hypothetical protein QN277_012437 [Acacia crassicarpa]
MLDGLLGRGFAAKCKGLIKLTKNRIDVIRRKRKATEKFLKKDIADLLANGLDINAHGRAEGLLIELTLSSCYDFIEKSCDFVLKHLSVMQKLSGCPEECRDAVSSLMFAAARFSDLPELRDLRQIFQERYENSMECYVNQEFAANVNSRPPPTLEKKVHLMQEIASEFSITWDSKAFEQRMQKPSPLVQDRNYYNNDHLTDRNKPSLGNNPVIKGFKCDVPLQKSPGHLKDGHKFQNGKEADLLVRDYHNIQSESKLPRNGVGKINGGDDAISRRNGYDNTLLGRLESTTKKSDRGYWKEDCMLDPNGSGCSLQGKRVEHLDVGSKLHDSWGNTTSQKVGHDTVAAKKPDLNLSHVEIHLKRNVDEPSTVNGAGLHDTVASKKLDFYTSHAEMHLKPNVNEPTTVNRAGLPEYYDSERKVQKDETPRVKPCYNNALPPPYVKPNSKQKNVTCEVNIGRSSDVAIDGIHKHPSAYDQPHAATVSDRSRLRLDNSDTDRQTSRHARRGRRSHEKELYDQEDMSQVPVLLKPKSMRRKHSKSEPSHNIDDSAVDAEVVTRKSRSRIKDESRPRHGLKTLFDDEQHRNDEEERMIDKLLIHYSKKPSIPLPEKARRKSKSRHAHQMDGGVARTPEMFTHRSISLPHEETGAEKVNKVLTRAATFQADRSSEARHVHPNLPDCDDLAARIAALRGI